MQHLSKIWTRVADYISSNDKLYAKKSRPPVLKETYESAQQKRKQTNKKQTRKSNDLANFIDSSFSKQSWDCCDSWLFDLKPYSIE